MKKGEIFKNWLTGELVKITNIDKNLKIVEYDKSRPYNLFDEKNRVIRTVENGAKPIRIFKKIYVKQPFQIW